MVTQREAEARRLDAQTALDQMNMKLRSQLIGALTGNGGGFASPPSPQQQLANVASGQPATPPAPKGGLIGQTVDNLMADSSLNADDKRAIQTAGNQALLKSFLEPEKALDGVTDTYNGILTRRGENERAIKVEENQPYPGSPTGYAKIATRPDGSQAYPPIPTAPPVPKNLEESSSYLGSAQLAYQRDPTPGNESALDLYQKQHDAMYADHIHEIAQNAAASARARGADVEAMYKTGKNPLTGEALSLNNAPPGALVNPTTGQVIPQDMVTLYKPTQNERQTADTARQVLAISKDLRDQVTQHPDLIGPLAGRDQQALQKIGISSQNAAKLIDDVTFLQSAATKMHTGRFSSEILQKMNNIVKPGMGKDEFFGSLDSINDVANRYADEDKLTTVFDYQQRQQFENQGAGGTNAQPKPQAGGGGFFEQFGGKSH